jgi:hypothetical protein
MIFQRQGSYTYDLSHVRVVDLVYLKLPFVEGGKPNHNSTYTSFQRQGSYIHNLSKYPTLDRQRQA